MNFENIVVAVCAIGYIAVGIVHFVKGSYPWALIWCCYGVANMGLMWASNIKN